MDVPEFFGGFVHSGIIDSGTPVLTRGSNGDLEYSLTDVQAHENFGIHTQLSLATSRLQFCYLTGLFQLQ
jgi:hypothetical protein